MKLLRLAEKAVRKLHLGGAAVTLLSPFCGHGSRTMTPEEAERVLQTVRPRRPVTCLLSAPRAWAAPRADVSVIIPTWNNGPYIADCVRSALSQETGHSFELIVIDDGSTDDTADRLSAFAGDGRVRIVHQPNKGVSAARNLGLEMVEGRYLYFLDGDDLLLPGMLEKLLSVAEAHGAAIVEGGYSLCGSDGAVRQSIPHREGRLGGWQDFSGFVCGKLLERSLFREVCFPACGYEDSIMSQILAPAVFEKGGAAWGIREPVFCYRFNPGGITQTLTSTPKAVDHLYITEALMRDRAALGLECTQSYYEHLLDMLRLGQTRAAGLPEEQQLALFTAFRALLLRAFPDSHTTLPRQERLEKAMKRNSFGQYRLICALTE